MDITYHFIKATLCGQQLHYAWLWRSSLNANTKKGFQKNKKKTPTINANSNGNSRSNPSRKPAGASDRPAN